MPGKKNYAHLDFDKRCSIEKHLNAGMTLSFIATELGIPLSTVAREVKRNRRDDGHIRLSRVSHVCKHRRNCAVRALCKERHCRSRRCVTCKAVLCTNLCQYFEKEVCARTSKAPYVCNGCVRPQGCPLHRYRYDAKTAQCTAEARLKDSRSGVNATEERFEKIVGIVRPLLKAGLGLDAIWCEHKDELGISKRTLYRWCEQGLGLCNMDLPKKVSYRPRKKTVARMPALELEGRTYADFSALPEDVRASAFEMDCVEGLRSDSKVILTLFHRRTHFQFGVLLEKHDGAHVAGALDFIESACNGKFKSIFSVILTDRGKEFL
jgi:IS30 family transposase